MDEMESLREVDVVFIKINSIILRERKELDEASIEKS